MHNIQTDRWTEGQTGIQTVGWTDRKTNRHTDRQADMHTGRQAGRQAYRSIDRQTDSVFKRAYKMARLVETQSVWPPIVTRLSVYWWSQAVQRA